MTKPVIRRWDECCRIVDIGYVNVRQSIKIETMKPGRPQINWSAVGSVGIKDAKKFMNDLYQAITLAKVMTAKDISWERPPLDVKKFTVTGPEVDWGGLGEIEVGPSMILWLPPRPKPVKG